MTDRDDKRLVLRGGFLFTSNNLPVTRMLTDTITQRIKNGGNRHSGVKVPQKALKSALSLLQPWRKAGLKYAQQFE